MTNCKASTMIIVAIVLSLSPSCRNNPQDNDNETDGVRAPRGICDKYLACLGEANPSAMPDALEDYGDGSACWSNDSEDAEACARGCIDLFVPLNIVHHDIEECACLNDLECGDIECDLESGACLFCLDGMPCSSSDESCTIEPDFWNPDEEVVLEETTECSTNFCLLWEGRTFCTHECEEDFECDDLENGRCEAEVSVGPNDMVGMFCVPAQ